MERIDELKQMQKFPRFNLSKYFDESKKEIDIKYALKQDEKFKYLEIINNIRLLINLLDVIIVTRAFRKLLNKFFASSGIYFNEISKIARNLDYHYILLIIFKLLNQFVYQTRQNYQNLNILIF